MTPIIFGVFFGLVYSPFTQQARVSLFKHLHH